MACALPRVRPVVWLFEADQMDAAPRCQLLEIGEHLALPERLEHAVIADVEDAGADPPAPVPVTRPS